MQDQTLEIAASEFKAKCLDLMDQLAARKLDRIIVTKRGRPVAVLTPPPTPEEVAEGLFGCLKGRMVAPADFDFTAPVLDEPLNAAEGRLYEE
jgi:prevent-host-death family protein